MITEKEIWRVLDDVKDPEIPKVSVVDMGIIFLIWNWGFWIYEF